MAEETKPEVVAVEESIVKQASKLDLLIGKLVSRKLFVMILGTVLLLVDKLSSELWVGLALGYVGVQGITDMVTKWKEGKTSDG